MMNKLNRLFGNQLSSLLNFDSEIISLKAPNYTSGIYFLFDEDLQIYYVGKTKNLKTRLQSHISGNSNLNKYDLEIVKFFVFMKLQEDSIYFVEQLIIDKFKPIRNKQGNSFRGVVFAATNTKQPPEKNIVSDEKTKQPWKEDTTRDYYNVHDIAEILHFRKETVRSWFKKGFLKGTLYEGTWQINKNDFYSFLESKSNQR